jgi:signal transduction histidine kinase
VEDLSLASAIAEELGVILENLQLRQRIEEAIVIKERRRLARDLHDSVTQSLHSLVLSAHTASNRLKQGDLTRLETSLDQLSEAARHALKEMRLLLYEMRLVPLQQVDMVEALHMRLEMVEGRAGIDGRLEVADGASWPKAWEGDLFCIASEALNNSLKYGQAAAVTVRLRGDPASLYLEIVDNGRGFDPQRFTGGMGLINMRERAERLGGRMEIHSAPGHGARIVLQTGGFKE